MRSDFMAAINQVCHERQLPLETVLEAVEVALVSAYKRNYGGNNITARIDQDAGNVKIFVEKEVVEEVLDDKNEISLTDARLIDPEAELESVVQIEDTPDSFGRIAAQTTKQVILQRIREAERDALYDVYSEREGEIVNGTVHKIDPHQVILSLGKVEANLPRAEQIPTERYSEGQRLRAYVSEVIRTPRGPQILVSRTHRNMLRRLLEVEVPEIYNGTVEIKAIAREAGYRSKVAVAALQEGVDPVGSCVGMRGVRIQSIVHELHGEKIDVAQWSPDTRVFIANALSPAKVLNVILQDIGGDKTAMVVVPDKQLSLAIGKEGQNARLAAKLTGWRIDIKSAIEAAEEALAKARESQAIKNMVSDRPEVFSLASAILSELEEGQELTQGELQLLSEAIELVGQAELTINRERREEEIATRRAQQIRTPHIEIDLLAEAEAILAETASSKEVTEDSEALQAIEARALDIDPDDLAAVAAEMLAETTDPVEAETETEDVAAQEAEAVVAAETPDDLLLEAALALDEDEGEGDLETSDEAVTKLDTEVDEEPQTMAAVAEAEAVLAPPVELENPEDPDFIPSVLDTIVEEEPQKPKKQAKQKKLKPVLVDDDSDPYDELSGSRKRRSKGRTLEFDEDLGQVVTRRHRKRSRSRDDWEEYLEDEDF